jgi:hypothetical protein
LELFSFTMGDRKEKKKEDDNNEKMEDNVG